MRNLKLVKIIETKFIGPTNHRGSRVKARDCAGNNVTISWDSSLGIEENHARAADELLKRIAAKNKESALVLTSLGSGLNQNGFVFVAEVKS